MRLRKKTKRKLQITFIVLLIFMMLLPISANFIPQKNTGIDPRIMEEMQKANEQPDRKIEGTYQITDFVSGNCFTILYGQEPRDVKLIGIKDKSCSVEDLQTLVSDNTVALAFDAQEEDEDGNLLAYAYRADETFINRELLALGLAKLNKEERNTAYAEDLQLAEESAKAKSLGIWTSNKKGGRQ